MISSSFIPIRHLRFVQRSDLGMTLVEMIIAMMMLVSFGTVFVAFSEFTSQFMREAESSLPGSQGLLVDHHDLQMAMDQMVEVLSQPGLSSSDLQAIEQKGCVYDPMSGSLDDMSSGWGLPGKSLFVPPGYKFCLRSTSLSEASIGSLQNGAKPAIYFIQALPDEVSAASLPTRRIFCRPKPFC